jgi:hypothetical protein
VLVHVILSSLKDLDIPKFLRRQNCPTISLTSEKLKEDMAYFINCQISIAKDPEQNKPIGCRLYLTYVYFVGHSCLTKKLRNHIDREKFPLGFAEYEDIQLI